MSSIELEIKDSIAYVWLNRPEKLNAIDLDILRGSISIAREITKNRDLRGVILAGRGASFSAGLDFPSVTKKRSNIIRGFIPGIFSGQNLFQKAPWIWRTLPVPVVAAVHGHCFGAGLQIASGADFRITTPDAKWSILEGKWGLVPDMSATAVWRDLIRDDVARRLVMSAETFSGEQALGYGLATDVSEDPIAAAEALIALIAQRSPDSVAASKALLNKTRHGSKRRAFSVERRLQLAMFRSPNTKIARKAIASKTEPKFNSRTFG